MALVSPTIQLPGKTLGQHEKEATVRSSWAFSDWDPLESAHVFPIRGGFLWIIEVRNECLGT